MRIALALFAASLYAADPPPAPPAPVEKILAPAEYAAILFAYTEGIEATRASEAAAKIAENAKTAEAAKTKRFQELSEKLCPKPSYPFWATDKDGNRDGMKCVTPAPPPIQELKAAQAEAKEAVKP